MTRTELFENIIRKQSFLCVGLDTDITGIPRFLIDKIDDFDPMFEFNKTIIDATADLCVAFKLNSAFYECAGMRGWKALVQTVKYIRTNYPDQFIIADVKRGDIGNTSLYYAHTFLYDMDFDAVTVAPYMGKDSVTPFLFFENKWTILLALTSNDGAFDFQFIKDAETGDLLYEKVLKKSMKWGNPDNMMYVVGATKAEMLAGIRTIVPEHFLLIPGVGAQGGSLADVVKYGMNDRCGLLVNSSRAIIYASNGEDFGEAARGEAQKIQKEMSTYLSAFK